MPLAVGQPAPEFATTNQDGATVRLSGLRGRPVLLFFYPKDETPGCRKEACSLRDAWSDYRAAGVAVLGLSRQGAGSHRAFRDNHSLPFDLLTDADGAIAKAYGIPTIPLLGWFRRRSVLVGADGTIQRIYDRVDPASHAAQVLRDLKAGPAPEARPG